MKSVLRSIPAWAGETAVQARYDAERRVYPRVGGGNRAAAAQARKRLGLSPRGRGKRGNANKVQTGLRSIPAWAGETVTLDSFLESIQVYPRVGGGNANKIQTGLLATGLSPRGRGKPMMETLNQNPSRSIPAWAGETHA